MMNESTEKQEAPKGVMATIAAGFDLTTKHWGLLLLPVALDLFYWLGPRLSLDTLLRQVIMFWQEQAELADVSGMDFAMFLDVAQNTNLFTSLSVPFIGVPAFVAGIMPESSPLTVNAIEVTGGGMVFLLFLFLTVVGLFLTAVYYNLISLATQPTPPMVSFNALAGKVVRNWLHLLLFALVMVLAMLILYVPLALISGAVALLSPVLAIMVLFVMPVLLGWLLIYFFFAPHGMIVNGRSLWMSMLESLMLVQQNLITTLGFILTMVLIGQILDWILLIATDGSWFMIVSILAHSFVNTALVVASFIFYRERLAHTTITPNRFYTPHSTVKS